MYYTPTNLADATDALTVGTTKSIFVSGGLGGVLVHRREANTVHNVMTQHDYAYPLLYAIGIPDTFKTKYMRGASIAYDDAATALLAAQRIVAGTSGLYDAIKTGDRMDGFNGALVSLDKTETVPDGSCGREHVTKAVTA